MVVDTRPDKIKNSDCHEIGKLPFSSLAVKRKSEELEKHNTVRSSDRDKEKLSTSYSGLKESAKERESVCMNRKKLTGRAFKSLLQRKCNNGSVPGSKRSVECDNSSLLGPCILCSKEKRISYYSQEKELCTCDATTRKETYSDCQMDDHGTMCAVCYNDSELLRCEGKDCKSRYHRSCLDPCLPDDLPGVRHCPNCVDKKLELGIYSVSEGVESIWDVREVVVAKGIRQRQYLVKYHGLAHVHNHWVPEKQLLLKHQTLVSNFVAKDETARWSVEWTVPHRLLRRRPILSKFHTASSADTSESYEWLVKWHALDYDHATWELDSSCFLTSSLGRELMAEYETRREKAKREVNKCQKESFAELSELPASGLNENDNFPLKNVNKLRECWYKCQNTVVFDDQDRATTLVFFIQSLTETCHPFLIVAASELLSRWEAEFARLAPSVDVVVYNGNSDTRKGIRASEFYEEGGCVMLQVLLSSPEAVFEDLDIMSCIRWQSIVIDEYQHSRVSVDLEQIKILTTDSRILLLSGQIKDTASEYLNILSLLDSEHEYNKLRGLRSGKNENLAKLKEKLSRFIAYGSTSEVSKFLEYWVPVQISEYQLEQYCSTLISNSILLCSCSRNDGFGALRDILLTVRKCCDHPYLVDSSIQEQMIAEGRPADEILDVGIKASGKLQLLEMMLTQVKARELKVLVLFQSVGSGGCSTGYILADFLAQKFGQNSYERIFSGVSPATKQASVNRFNKKENGQFVLLLENRACSSTIKLLSLDAIVLYNSDWNPANDFKALQKVSIDLAVDQIKVFRLYLSLTVEERALLLAKKNLNLDNNLQASSRASSDSLLMWGAARLFSELDDYHSESSSELNSTSRQSLLVDVREEFEAIVSECGEISRRVPVISKVKLGVGSYSANVPMLAEGKVKLNDVEEPHIFWRNLLDRKSPRWKHIMGRSSRNRKRVHYLDGSLVQLDIENDDVGKKRRRALIKDVYQAPAPAEQQRNQETQVAASEGGPSRIIASSSSQSLLKVRTTSMDSRHDTSGRSTFSHEVDECGAEERNASSDEQKSPHNSLQEEMERLCQILNLSEVVTHTLRRFLEYVILKHSICRGSPSVMQAFQISLLWVAASISKQEVDKTESLILAKQLLNYECTEEQVHSVYSKMLDLKWKYLRRSLSTTKLGGDCLLAEENTKNETSNFNEGNSPSSSVKLENVTMKIEENSTNEEHSEGQILSQPKHAIDSVINELLRKCDKRMKKLIRKQKREIQEFYQNWEVKKLKLEADHKLASALIRCIYGEGPVRTVKLKMLDGKFAKEMEENNLQLKDLEAKQLAVRNEEKQKAAHWIAKAKAHCSSELSTFSTSVSMAAGEVGSNASTGTPNNLLSFNQPKLTQEFIWAKLPASGDEIGSVELNKEARKEMPENVVVDNVNPDVMNSATSYRCDKEDTVGLPDALVNKIDGTDNKSPGVLILARQISEPLEQTYSLHRRDLLPSQVPEDQTRQSLSSELQDQGAQAVGDQSTFLLQVVASKIADLATISHSSSKLQDQVAPTPAVEDPGNLQIEGTNSAQCGIVTPDMPGPTVEDHDSLNIGGANSAQGGTYSPNAPAPAVEDHCTLHIEGTNSFPGVTVNPDAHAPAVEDLGNLQIEGTNSAQGGIVTPDMAGPTADHDTLNIGGANSAQGGTFSPNALAPAVEDHGALNIEGTKSPPGVTVNPDAHAPAAEDLGNLQIEGTNSTQGGIVTPLQSNDDEQATENLEKLKHVSIDEPPSENESTAIEVETQNRDSGKNSTSQTTEGAESEIFLHESASCTGTDLVTQTNYLKIGHEPNVELSAHSQTNVVMSQEVVGTVESASQVVMQLGTDLGHQDTSWDAQFLFAQLFQKQLENIGRETEQLEKSREETMSRLKSDFEKEVQEIIAQALQRYEVKLRDAEAEYILKKNGLGENLKKVWMNRILAKAFSSICLSAPPGIQQDIPSHFMQPLHQPSLRNPVRHAPAVRPAVNLYSHQEIHAPASDLQAFRPAAPSLIPQHNLQLLPSQIFQSPPTTFQNRPEHEGAPLWGPSLPALGLLRAVDHPSGVSGGLNFFGFN